MRFFTFVFLSLLLWPVASPGQELAAWVVRFDIETPEQVEAICAQARSNRFDRLLVQVRGRADAYYTSDIVPAGENLEPDFDPLAQMLEHCQGVEIDAWLNVYYLWTGDTPPLDPRHPASNKDWLIRDHQGRRVDSYTELEQSQRWIEGLYADPASESYRRYFKEAVVELVSSYPVTGIHLDFVRYPGAYFGGGGKLAADFRQDYGVAVKQLPERLNRQDFAAWLNGSLPPNQHRLVTARLLWDHYRAQEVTKLVAMVRAALEEARPGIRLSASVFPDPLLAFVDKGQDWPTWLTKGLVDELFIMNYFGDKARVQSLYQGAVDYVGSSQQLWLGLGSYIKSADEIGQEVALCRLNSPGTCFFSLGHLLNQRKLVKEYIEAVRTPPDLGEDSSVAQLDNLSTAFKEVKQCLARLTEPGCQSIRQSAADFFLPPPSRGSPPAKAATWLELRGIFRYVDPHDPFERVEEQLELARESYEMLKEGIPFAEVAQDYSQAGSRYHGGLLPRRFLHDDNRVDQLLAELEPGQISPVLPVYNGFWVYQVVGKGRL